MVRYWLKILKRTPSSACAVKGRIEGWVLFPSLLFAALGNFIPIDSQVSSDPLRWLLSHSWLGWIIAGSVCVWAVAKAVYEEHDGVESKLEDCQTRLDRLEEMHPLMEIHPRTFQSPRRGAARQVFVDIRSDSICKTVNGVRLHVTAVRSRLHGPNELQISSLNGPPQLLSGHRRTGESINSGSSISFEVASYDRTRGQIRIGHHHDTEGFGLAKGRHFVTLVCSGRDVRQGEITLLIGVDGDDQITFEVV